MAGIDASPRTSETHPGVELEPIQLVAPDGTPTAETRYRRDLPPETLAWLYESMVVTRELDTEFVNLQRQGELALFASCRGQEAAQIGAAACLPKTDWLFPQYREIGAFLLRGHHAGADGRGLAGQMARRAGVHREVCRADLDPDRHARPARGRCGDGRPTPRRGLGDTGVSRRRRDQRGRCARSAELRSRVQGAVRVRRAEQPLGDIGSGQQTAWPGRRSRTGPSATECPGFGWTATTCWPAMR